MSPADARVLVEKWRGTLVASLVMAEIEVESGFNERAFLMDRNGGSYGLMQLDYQTALDRGFQGTPDGLYDPETNVEFGCKQLVWIQQYLQERELSSEVNMIAAYNEGVGAVVEGRADPQYVAKVLKAKAKWEELGNGN